jgi:S-adenosylmethionine:tRNA ribosyltransferase-isomerase
MQLSDFDFELPEELIAQQPLPQRDASRMLVLDRQTSSWTDSRFAAFPDYVKAGDVVVVNNTQVFPARLVGRRSPTGGRVEVLLVREIEPSTWEVLARPGNRLKPGDAIEFGDLLQANVLAHNSGQGFKLLRFESRKPFEAILDELGQTPLPPYIKRPTGDAADDRTRYQTIFASSRGAIAAPTAGLHFTPEIKSELVERGATVAEITLHVGYGTFEPIRVSNLSEHRVAAEFVKITAEAASSINEARAREGRVIAVGTTTTRALESAVDAGGNVYACETETGLTITSGHKFRVIDALLTNFHLPRSSLLLLVSAFAGYDLTLDAYRHAVEQRYRFYSYGDCMLVI